MGTTGKRIKEAAVPPDSCPTAPASTLGGGAEPNWFSLGLVGVGFGGGGGGCCLRAGGWLVVGDC